MTLPVEINPHLLGSAATGYQIERSLRFNSADSAYLDRTLTSNTNRRISTFSCWAKLGSSFGTIRGIFYADANGSAFGDSLLLRSDNTLGVSFSAGSSFALITTQVFRDPSAWYHFVLAIDTTQATSSNRVKLYVNGSQITAFGTALYPTQNYDPNFNSAIAHTIGRSTTSYYDGYLTEINFIDGQALTPSDFGETNPTTGVWQPIEYTGTYGTNGFYLPFKTGSAWSGFFDGSGDWLGTASNSVFNFGTGSFTLECWFNKRGAGGSSDGVGNVLVYTGDGSNNAGWLGVTDSGTLIGKIAFNGSSWVTEISGGSISNGTWYHAALVRNGSTVNLYLNGVSVANTTNSTDLSTYGTNSAIATNYNSTRYFNGHISNARINKSAVYTTGFTPSTSPLTAIANTSLLTCQGSTFVDNSGNSISITTNGDARTQNFSPFVYDIPDDHSGQNNHWYPNNLDLRTSGSGADSLVDTPTPYGADTGVGGEVRGNYCTLNRAITPKISGSGNHTISNGALTFTRDGGNGWGIAGGTTRILSGSGKYYYELAVTTNTPTGDAVVGFHKLPNGTFPDGLLGYTDGPDPDGYGYAMDGSKLNNGGSAYGDSWSSSDVIGCAIDASGATTSITFYKNGVSQGVAFSGLSGDFIAAVSCAGNTININFGQRPFAYAAPTGFKALCTQNLPTPTIKDGSEYFNTVLYTGTGSSNARTGVGFQPDLVWIKERNASADNALYDSVRGVQKQLESNTTTDETTESTGLTAFGTDGFTVGSLAQVNTNTDTYVAWNWKKSTTSAFDIVTYTGNGSARTISHNLGVVPNMIIVKARTTASTDQGWPVYHSFNTAAPETDYLLFNDTAATADLNTVWNDTAPTSSVFSVGTNANVNANNDTYVAYLFASVAGYSAAFSYAGNGSTDGSFVFLGFRPRFILLKGTGNASGWQLHDTSRDPYNVATNLLRVDLANAEGTGGGPHMDILSNGFKLRTTDTNYNNASYGPYVGIAFAENPFKYSLAR